MRGSRGLTMVELLVTLGIIAIAMGGVLSVFFAAFGYSRRGREKAEAARTALAVYGLMDRGFVETGGNAHGRGGDGNLVYEGGETVHTVTCQQLASALGMYYYGPSWAPSYVTRTTSPLVWKCEVSQHPDWGSDDGCTGLHVLKITVSRDDDLDDSFDELDFLGDLDVDSEVARFSAYLADEDVP